MAERNRTAGPRAPTNRDEAIFTRGMRYEIAGEEGRALVGSYAISLSLAILFLLFVYLSDPPRLLPEDHRPVVIDVQFDDPVEPPPEPEPEPEQQQQRAQAAQQRQTPAPQPARQPAPRSPAPTRTQTASAGAISEAFGSASPTTGGTAGDVSGVLRGTEVASGTGGQPAGAGTGRVVVSAGGGGTGTATPGRGGIGAGSGTQGRVGGVSGSGSVSRGSVRVSAPRVVDAPDMAGPGRDMGELGAFVRSRHSELRFCYEESGLKVNPRLAGTIHVAITIAGSGAVTGARITSRTWSGAGVSATESCILSRIRAWRFPSSSAGTGTYSFPFNFTT